MSSRRWLLAWAVGYAAVGAASLAVPLYALSLGGDPLLVGVLASTAAFAGVPGAVVWGKRATRTHRPRFLALALATIGLSLLATAALTEPWLLVVPNALAWFVTAAAAPVLTLAGVDGKPESEWDREIARLNGAQGYGWVAGLVLGTVWTTAATQVVTAGTAHRLLFVVTAVGALAASILGYRWMPAAPRPDAPEETVGDSTADHRGGRSAKRRLRRAGNRLETLASPHRLVTLGTGHGRGAWRLAVVRRRERRFGIRRAGFPRSSLGRYLVGVTLCFFGFASFFGPLPAFLVDQQYSPDQIFLLFLVSSACAAVCYDPAATIAERLDGRRLHVGALAIRGLALPAVALVGAPGGLDVRGEFVSMVVLFGIVGASWAVVAVTAGGLVTRLASDTGRGRALGAYTALSNVGTGIGSALGGLLAVHLSYVAAFGSGAVLVLLGAATVLWSRPRESAPAG